MEEIMPLSRLADTIIVGVFFIICFVIIMQFLTDVISFLVKRSRKRREKQSQGAETK